MLSWNYWMPKLKITIFGDATELLISTFPKKGADWIMEYCEEFKPYTDIEEVWYGGLIPEEWKKGKESYEVDNIFHEFGFTFGERAEIQWFLDGNLVGRPKIKGIYVNGKIIKYNLSGTTRTVTKVNLPRLNKGDVFVYHGRVDRVSMDYVVDIRGHFIDKNLKLNFLNCSEYGYMLKTIDYEGKEMARFYSGSRIQVKSCRYDGFSLNDMRKVFKLCQFQDFLDVKFKIRR